MEHTNDIYTTSLNDTNMAILVHEIANDTLKELPKVTKKISLNSETLYDENKVPIDKRRFYKDQATDFVTNQILGSSTNLFFNRFLELVYTSFTTYLDKYWSEFMKIDSYRKNKYANIPRENIIAFIVKGGNINRVLGRSFLAALPNQTNPLVVDMSKYINKVISRSDLDFSIYINYHILGTDNYRNVIRQVKILSFYVLALIREKFTNNIKYYSAYHNYPDDQKKTILEDYMRRMNGNILMNNVNKEIYCSGLKFENISVGRKMGSKKGTILLSVENNILSTKYEVSSPYDDKAREFFHRSAVRNDFSVGKKLSEYGNKNSSPYISFNNSIKVNIGDKLEEFSLVRTKINFVMDLYDVKNKEFMTGNIGGELIDVSISYVDPKNKIGKNTIHFFENVNKNITGTNNNITKYSITVIEQNQNSHTCNFYGISINYLIDDLIKILFIRSKLPWLDAKYKKRIDRLFIVIINYLAANPIYDNKKHMEELVQVYQSMVHISTKMYEIKKFNDLDFGENVLDSDTSKNIIETLNKISGYDIVKKLKLEHMFMKINEIIKDMVRKKNKQDEIVFITQMITFLDSITSGFKKILKMMIFLRSNQVDLSGQFADVQFGGINYRKKYLKYKQKYLAKRALTYM